MIRRLGRADRLPDTLSTFGEVSFYGVETSPVLCTAERNGEVTIVMDQAYRLTWLKQGGAFLCYHLADNRNFFDCKWLSSIRGPYSGNRWLRLKLSGRWDGPRKTPVCGVTQLQNFRPTPALPLLI